MRATLSQIEALYWIARLGSFRAAAAQLGLTQPSISLRIRGLEETLGCRVFERVGRQVRLSEAGSPLYPLAKRMMEIAEQVSAKQGPVDPLRGRLRLGAPASFALSSMADLLGTLKKPYPDLTVALTIERRRRRRQLVAAGNPEG